MPAATYLTFLVIHGQLRQDIRLFLLIMLFIGGVAAYEFVWELGDLGVGLMTVFNMIAIVPLSGQAINALKDYETNYKKKIRLIATIQLVLFYETCNCKGPEQLQQICYR